MENQKKAYIFAVSAVLLWSTVATAFKIALAYLNFIELLFFSSISSLTILLIIILIQNKFKLLFTNSKKEIAQSVLMGFLNPFLYYLILFKAYKLLPAQEALTLNYTWAILVVLLSIPLLKQKIRIINILALFVSFFGLIVIATHGSIINFKFSNKFGVALAIGSSLIWASFWLLNMKDKRDEIIKLFLSFFFGVIFISILGVSTNQISTINFTSYLSTVYIGFFEMGITFVLWLYALKYSNTTAQISNLIYLSPFLSLFFINLVIGEKILISTIVGLIFIVLGILLQGNFYKNKSVGKNQIH